MPAAKKTTTKKRATAPRTVKSSKVTSEELHHESTGSTATATSTSTSNPLPFKMKKSYLLTAILVVSAIVLIYLLRGFFVVAMVNGEPLTRLSVLQELEKQGGAQISDSLITQKLIRQEAREKNITASEKDINDEVKKLEDLYKEQGQKLDEVLTLRNMTREDLVDQIEVKILLDKLVGKVEVSEEEVQKFIEENNEAYGGTLQAADVKTELTDQKFNEKSSEYIAKLQKEAKIEYFVEY